MKSKKKTKVPAYAFGTQFKEIGGNMLENAPGIINTLMTPFQKSTATSGGEAVAQTLGDMVSGAALGFQVAGPMGAAVGALPGLFGAKGQEAEQVDFVNYTKSTKGKGLIGAITNRGLRKREARIKKNTYSNRAAVQGTNYLQSEAYDDMIGMNTDTMANGGMSSSLAYVDDGELIQTPDGSISKVPENNKPTDSNLVSLPEGSRVLSDKLKVPGRKETFAQLGEKMMAKKKSKYNDRFAENAAKLNEMNNNMIHDQLFAMQESVKQSKGIKPKTKQIQAAALGDEIKPGLGDRIVDAIYNPNRNWGASVQWGTGNNQWYHVPVNPSNTQPTSTTATVSTSTPTRRRKATSTSTNTGLIDEGKPELPFTWYGTVNPLKPKHPELLTATNDEMAGLGDALTSQADKVTTLPKSNAYNKPEPENNKFDWGSALSGMASLAPIMSNLFTGRPETVDAVYNPYATSITNTMRRRRYNINPAIEDLNRNRATSNYNASQINTNTGANLAYRLQSAVNTDRAIASLRSQESNVNNQYLGDYANTMNSLGQQWVNATNMANEANAQNRDTARNIRRAGLSQLSQWAQNRELMRNQKARDMEMWPLYQRFLQAGFTEDDLRAMMNSNRSTIKRKGGK